MLEKYEAQKNFGIFFKYFCERIENEIGKSFCALLLGFSLEFYARGLRNSSFSLSISLSSHFVLYQDLS